MAANTDSISLALLKEKAIIRLIDGDSHRRASYLLLLEQEGWHTIAYDNLQRFLNLDNTKIPGCLIVFIDNPEAQSKTILEAIRKFNSCLPVVIATDYAKPEGAVVAMKNKASDYILLPLTSNKLISLASLVKESSQCLEEKEFNVHLINLFEKLSPKERKVLHFVAVGLKNKQIASVLNLSEKTVQGYRSSILHKLKVKNTAEAVRYVMMVEKSVNKV